MNNSRINPMFADTAANARMVSDGTQLMINGIIPVPSAATWECIIQNGAEHTIFSANNNGKIPGNPALPFLTTGLVIDTLTNCTVLIYTTPS